VNLVDGVIGNSSSGLTEVPSFKKGTINIGDRQKGRLLASSVISVEPFKEDIKKGLSKLYSDSFVASLVNAKNPYGDVGSADKIHKIIKNIELKGILKKSFFQGNRIEV
jgi:GDP/UDP-N,N'-diacetylbacillosamine 2-epimerase (hydrolysing)